MKTLMVFDALSGQLKWIGQFTNDETLLNAVIDYSQRGFGVQVI